ncbi:MAG: HAD family hydrolase, partial [Tetragenococcus koreensis]|nr:HAD family hydrolase [Tetragenococcus koreensis]
MQAVFFDVDDTLYDQLRPFAKAFEKNFNFNDVPLEALYITSRKLSDEVFHLTENQQMDKRDMHIYRIKQALTYFGKNISYQQALSFQKDYETYQKEITLFPDIVRVFNICVANKIQMGVITNGPSEHQKGKIQQLGIQNWIPDKNIIISSEVGIAKPDIQIFHLAETRIHLKKESIYYVGDSFQNDMI